MTGFGRTLALLVTTLLVAGCAPKALSGGDRTTLVGEEFVACGKDNLVQFRIVSEQPLELEERWRWKPETYTGMPEKWREQFRHIDECRLLPGTERILITASTNGIGIVDRESRSFQFIGTAINAHSATILPGGFVAVAASNGGDELIIFDPARPEQRLAAAPLSGGHGVEWDSRRNLLVALGGTEVKLLRWTADRPSELEHEAALPLPERGGHNLSRVPGTDRFNISTEQHTWEFDLASRRFLPHSMLPDASDVKSMDSLDASRVLLWVQAEESWWSYGFRFILDGKALRIGVPDQFYKARWVKMNHRSGIAGGPNS